MASRRLFKGVAHDLAHHAQSGLSYMHPHVVRNCKAYSLGEVTAELLSGSPWPAAFRPSKPLRLATSALQETLNGFIRRQGLDPDDLTSANVTFQLVPSKDDWTTIVSSRLQLKNGKSYHASIPVTW